MTYPGVFAKPIFMAWPETPLAPRRFWGERCLGQIPRWILKWKLNWNLARCHRRGHTAFALWKRFRLIRDRYPGHRSISAPWKLAGLCNGCWLSMASILRQGAQSSRLAQRCCRWMVTALPATSTLPTWRQATHRMLALSVSDGMTGFRLEGGIS